jgi:hypothetical protein
MSPALSDRIAILNGITLLEGAHVSPPDDGPPPDEMCVMEAVAYVAGEPWSDHPTCACPILSAFLRSWNDALSSNADRDRLLKPLVLQLIDTKSTTVVEQKRAYLALDWLVRVFTPKWLDLVPELAIHSAALRGLQNIVDIAGALAAKNLGDAARAAAWEAAWDAAGAAAGAAAWDAARAAAGDAAWDAAGAAAGDAARAAARDAAGDAARDAAWDAAGDAAGDAARDAAGAAARAAARAAAGDAARDAARAAAGARLKPTTEWLQASALELVGRMIRVQS